MGLFCMGLFCVCTGKMVYSSQQTVGLGSPAKIQQTDVTGNSDLC